MPTASICREMIRAIPEGVASGSTTPNGYKHIRTIDKSVVPDVHPHAMAVACDPRRDRPPEPGPYRYELNPALSD